MQGFGGITKRYRAANDVPHDGVWLFQRTLQALALITVVLIGAVLVVGCGQTDAEVTAALVAAADARKANVPAEGRAAAIQMSHPLGYAATVRDCLPSGRQCTPTRYYFAKGAQ